ncbi:4Fe-4S binding protein [Muriicola sp. Z0-33]|uniref:4Fe-4S binding protein n=1 Tax=Muriicola sp. Z0-33 TaxID=2816957 RepID=UPI0022385568|nr:4Fe-4S binding protein [Muriicola sp. Z0-33]MCW5516983.1 4Fe-4S binding protein [Muriicola sp. Z0-33]
MKDSKYILSTGNEAAAHIAYKTNEICAIYPITPASEMSEAVATWAIDNKKNIFGSVPSVFEMQSEAGVAGALHGALQTGALATTFTASQGLLLMLPNMYKIAAELTPNVIHVATRTLATHALSVFGDHSDIMAARNTGYAFLGAANVQETMDFALLSQAASLKSRIPFVHFFDGFRTSHETSKIELVPDEVIKTMLDEDAVMAHKTMALDPNRPVLRGTSQGPDVFFQAREAINRYYDACPDLVQEQMDKFANLTGRRYKLYEYTGHPQASQVIVAMGAATETIAATIKELNAKGSKIGLIKVKLFRPFSAKHLLKVLPKSCETIAVLDKTKEPGAAGEPLYLDILQAIMQSENIAAGGALPKVVGGRYGLSSKEFTPGMVTAIVDNLKKEQPKNGFTIGINDDVTKLSLPYTSMEPFEKSMTQAIFYETKSENTRSSFKTTMELLTQDNFVQGYTEIDYRKSNARNVRHLRVGPVAVRLPYLINQADFIYCESLKFIVDDDALKRIKRNGVILLRTSLSTADLKLKIPTTRIKEMAAKNVVLCTIDENAKLDDSAEGESTLAAAHSAFLEIYPSLKNSSKFKSIPALVTALDYSDWESVAGTALIEDPYFGQSLLGMLLSNNANDIPVSLLPADGTYPTDTAKYNSSGQGNQMPWWDMDACTQCGACSMACPQGAIRIKALEDEQLERAPASFKTIPSKEFINGVAPLNYRLQINPDQCNSCHNCVEACLPNALELKERAVTQEAEFENWEFFKKIPEFDRTKIDRSLVSQQQLQEPLFKYSTGVDGCGEAPYLKLISQLFGERMLVANATGASSIFGGALPTTPWSKNADGKGPAWSNSLFEDNAEFGLGFRLSLDQKENHAKQLLITLKDKVGRQLVDEILSQDQDNENQIAKQRNNIHKLKTRLAALAIPEAKQLISIADSLVKKSIWIVGGDGWAYDIGFGGLDHVLSSGKNVNILVLDNEVYSNTGGQMSKATPYGAAAKFADKGKLRQKKDLGLMAMNYEGVYIASVAIGADQQHTLNAFLEAESFDGPSLIIAYCHSPAHGIDLKAPAQYHKAAVDSGQWLLYRNDPMRGLSNLNTLQLDSEAPSLPIEEYLRLEKRFRGLFQNDKESFNSLKHKLQLGIDSRYDRYLQLASNSIPNRTQLLRQQQINSLHATMPISRPTTY